METNNNPNLCECFKCKKNVNGEVLLCTCLYTPILSEACANCGKQAFCFVVKDPDKYPV